MTITYSGTIVEITEALSTLVANAQGGVGPSGTALAAGTVAVQPGGASSAIDAGNFSIDTEDLSSVLDAYRLVVTAALSNALEADPRVVFRSGDLFRTGSGWTEAGLDVFVAVLSALDLYALKTGFGIDIPLPYLYTSMLADAQASVPTGVTVTNVSAQGTLIRFDVEASGVTGNFTAAAAPDTSSDFQSYLQLSVVDVNLDGFMGAIAEWSRGDIIRANIQDGLNQATAGVSRTITSSLAGALTQLPSALRGQLTVTLLDTRVEPTGLNATPALGLLQHSAPDPCQSLRDRLANLKMDLVADQHEDLSTKVISNLETQIAQTEQELTACVASHAAGPAVRPTHVMAPPATVGTAPPGPPAPPRPTPTPARGGGVATPRPSGMPF